MLKNWFNCGCVHLFVLAMALSASSSTYAAAPGDALEGEYVVTDQGNARNPAIARDADGDYVVVWAGNSANDDKGIYYKVFDRSGQSLQEAPKLANLDTVGIQQNPAVAMDAVGNFVITWEGPCANTVPVGAQGATCPNAPDLGFEIYARVFNVAGEPLGPEFLVNTTFDSDQSLPAVAMSPLGRFVIAWQSLQEDDDAGLGIYARRFNAGGNPLDATEFHVNRKMDKSQSDPTVAIDVNGNFVIVWTSNHDSADEKRDGIYLAQGYAAGGQPVGTEIHVNQTTPNEQQRSSVGMASNGDYVVAWQGGNQSVLNIFARRFKLDGVPHGGEFQVNTAQAKVVPKPAMAVDADGDFAIAWESGDSNNSETVFRLFKSDGTATTSEAIANATTAGVQGIPSLAVDADGDIVIAWQSGSPASNCAACNIVTRRFAGPENVDLSASVSAAPDPVAPSSLLIYELTVTNHHSRFAAAGNLAVDSAIGAATGIVVTDGLPPEVIFESYSGDLNWTCASPDSEGHVVCAYGGVLGAGDSTSFAIAVRAPSWNTEITNSVSVSAADQFDANSGNDNDSATTKVCSPCISITPNIFTNPTKSVVEGDQGTTTLAIEVYRVGKLTSESSVRYSFVDLTASNADYEPASGVVTFGPNIDQVTMPVTIKGDYSTEATETFQILLSSPVNGVLQGDRAIVSIVDDDPSPSKLLDLQPTISISPSKEIVEGDAGTTLLTFEVYRIGDLSGTSSVNYSTIEATASLADFVPTAGQVQFAPGQEAATIQIAIRGDSLLEAPESFLVRLNSSADAVLGADTAVGTIVDDDF